uniref:Uncharacterized protein n=1 Tax=Octopus bimaculoides TaxID=37653 RepID=A0A0L8H9K1_OCTBM
MDRHTHTHIIKFFDVFHIRERDVGGWGSQMFLLKHELFYHNNDGGRCRCPPPETLDGMFVSINLFMLS